MTDPALNRRFDGLKTYDDPRDWPVSRLHLPPLETAPTYRYWFQDGWHGNQGINPHCVAFAFAHWLNDGPKLYSLFRHRRPGVDTTYIYCEAQKLDPWPGDCDDPKYAGTTIRSGAKVMQRLGFVSNYYWARNASEIIQAVLTVGTVVIGTRWYEGMSRPDTNNLMWVTGREEGGHATVVTGVNTDTGLVRIKNSWGRSFGDNGHAYMTIDEFTKLTDLYVDACVLIQQPARVVEAEVEHEQPVAA